jgi:hypothetical protein
MGLLLAVASYGFYALWHSEAVVPASTNIVKKSDSAEDLSRKKHIARKNTHSTDNPLEVLAKSSKTDADKKREKVVHDKAYFTKRKEEIAKNNSITYENLKPDNYEEVMAEAEENFALLDIKMEKIKERIEAQTDLHIVSTKGVEYE